MPRSLISVPKIWMGTGEEDVGIDSTRHIAIEYASSPDEQPGTQIRTGISAFRSCNRRGRILSLSACEGLGITEETGDIDQNIFIQCVQFRTVGLKIRNGMPPDLYGVAESCGD